MKQSRKLVYGFSALTALLLMLAYYVVQEQGKVRKMIEQIHSDNIDISRHIAVPSNPVVERVVSKRELWHPAQERAKNAVVQVFAQVAEVNICEPYASPHQYAGYGSAFFINEDGYLITNAHVVNQARVWIQVPSLGKQIIDVDVIGISPEGDRDLALLRVKPEKLESLREQLGGIPYLEFGDSDFIQRSDEVMALGYPLGQESLKSTVGIISGRQGSFMQIDAAINPGNSGGPTVDLDGRVIGINTAKIQQSGVDNVGYFIPINVLKNILPDLHREKLLRKPFLGVLYANATDLLTEFLGNPYPGGCYIVEVVKGSTLHQAGIQRGDMIYSINGNELDIYGDMRVPWSDDKISIVDYVSRLAIGQELDVIVYRNGVRKELTITFDQTELPAIRRVYPTYEELDYEIIGGMVVMPLTLNHIQAMINAAPGLAKFADMQAQHKPALIITHIFQNSQLYRSRTLRVGSTIHEVNGIEVETLEDFRNAIKSGIGSPYLTLRASDNVMRLSDNIFVVLPFDQVLQEESMLSMSYKYPISDTVNELLQIRMNNVSGGISPTVTA